MRHDLIERALVSGTIAGTAIVVAAALAGKRETSSYAAPINATSHILWGGVAAQKDRLSWKYTGAGLLLNHAAAVFWAACYEKLMSGRARRGTARPLLGGALVSAAAYVTDYHLVPKRLTPGYEERLSGKSLALIYGVLALGLAARDLLRQPA